MDIIIDFDGTCTSHDFPRIGKDIGAVPVLKKLTDKGHRLILFTMRSDDTGPATSNLPEIYTEIRKPFLTEAVNWFKDNAIPLYGIQTNPDQHTWTSSPKAYGHLHIDDAALGCPLSMDSNISERPYVDWVTVERLLTQNNII